MTNPVTNSLPFSQPGGRQNSSASPQLTDHSAARSREGLAFSSLAQSGQQYFEEDLAPSTRLTYNSVMKFCTTYQITDPFPVTEKQSCYFVVYMAIEGLATRTGKLAVVQNMQLSLGLRDSREQYSFPVLKCLQAGISRLKLNSGFPPQSPLHNYSTS